MRWLGLTADVLLLVSGIVILLYAYRVFGKPRGADENFDATMARSGVMNKWLGWCIVAVAIFGILDHLSGGLL